MGIDAPKPGTTLNDPRFFRWAQELTAAVNRQATPKSDGSIDIVNNQGQAIHKVNWGWILRRLPHDAAAADCFLASITVAPSGGQCTIRRLTGDWRTSTDTDGIDLVAAWRGGTANAGDIVAASPVSSANPAYAAWPLSGGSGPTLLPIIGSNIPPMGVVELTSPVGAAWNVVLPTKDRQSLARLVTVPAGISGVGGTGQADTNWWDVQKVQVYDPTAQTAVKKGDLLGSKYNDYRLQVDSVTGAIECIRRADIVIAPTQMSVVGGSSTGTPYLAVLSGPTMMDVTVAIVPDAGLTVTPSSLTFLASNWSTPQQVVVTATDPAADIDLHIAHTATSLYADYNNATGPTITVHVVKASHAPIAPSVTSLVAVENGAGVTYTLALPVNPAHDVTITLTPAANLNVGNGAGVAKTLTWLANGGTTAKTVTVAVPNTGTVQLSPSSAKITHVLASQDSRLAGISIPDVTVAIKAAQPMTWAYVRFVSIAAMCFLSVAAGYQHCLAMKPDGTVWAWGSSSYGQVGDGTDGYTVPICTTITGVTQALAIGCGDFHSLAITPAGNLLAWGNNAYGQLGDGTTTKRTTPTQINGIGNLVAVDGGQYHTIALKADGTVWTWGQNTYGQLGNGGTTDQHAPVQVSISNVVAIAAGQDFSIAVKADGTAWAWGRNNYGQLGNGSNTEQHSPAQMTIANAVAVAAGTWHTLVLKADGTCCACGQGSYGQIGNGALNDAWTPTPVNNLVGIKSIACGGFHCIAIDKDGIAKTWGRADSGQLAANNTLNQPSPITVPNFTGAMAAGMYRGTILLSRPDGNVFTCGDATNDELGNGFGTSSPVNVPTTIACANCKSTGDTYSKLLSVFSGGGGIKQDGSFWAWGDHIPFSPDFAYPWLHPTSLISDVRTGHVNQTHSLFVGLDGLMIVSGHNDKGQLGLGTLSQANTIVTPRVLAIPNVVMVRGAGNTSIILKSDGTVWAAGDGDLGGLADGGWGDGHYATTFQQVAGLSNIIAIDASCDGSAGARTFLALKSDGTVYAWGDNTLGGSGPGGRYYNGLYLYETARQVPGISNIVSICASGGGGTTIGITSKFVKNDGTIWTYSNGAMRYGSLTNVVKVAMSVYNWAALKDDGTVWGWGYNYPGDGHGYYNSDVPVPVKCLAGKNIVDIAGGYQLMSSLTSKGEIWSWGFAGSGLSSPFGCGDGTVFPRTVAQLSK